MSDDIETFGRLPLLVGVTKPTADSLDFKRRVASLESPLESAEVKIDPMPSKRQKIDCA